MPAGAKQAAEKVWFMVAFLENGAGLKPLSLIFNNLRPD
jgi:hypothetical protein